MMWAMFPEYKVWIDPRWGPYAGLESQKDWDDMSKWLEKDKVPSFIEKYPFKTAIVHFRYKSVIVWLLTSGEYRLVYFGNTAAVLVHNSVIPTMSEAALDTDLSTNRYLEMRNPYVLSNLFGFYVSIAAKYGKEIRNIYVQNVSSWYRAKEEQIKSMNEAIKSKEAEIEARKP